MFANPRTLLIGMAALAGLGSAGVAEAQLYSWRDGNGRMSYSYACPAGATCQIMLSTGRWRRWKPVTSGDGGGNSYGYACSDRTTCKTKLRTARGGWNVSIRTAISTAMTGSGSTTTTSATTPSTSTASNTPDTSTTPPATPTEPTPSTTPDSTSSTPPDASSTPPDSTSSTPPDTGTTIPMIVGINTHFAWKGDPRETDADLFRTWNEQARLTSSRDTMNWSMVEWVGPGVLQMGAGPLNTQTVWNSMPTPFSPLLILYSGNRYYDSGGQPKSAEAVSAFTRYADWVVGQNPLVRMVEVWNEWDLRSGASPYGGSQGDPVDYARLATETARVLKASHPGVKVLVGSIGDDWDWSWTKAAIQAGMLTNADGVAVHLYNYCVSPKNVGADMAIVRAEALRALLNNAGKPGLPIYVTEVGWPTHIGDCQVTEQDSALHTARFLLEASLRDWLAGLWIYEFQDKGTDITNRDHNFGVMRRIGTEKPSGCATRQLAATIAKRPKSVTRASGVTMARFANGATDRWIVWASQDKVYSVGNAQVRLASQSGSALPQPIAVCAVTGGTLSAATATLWGKRLFVLDLPASETITMQPLN